MHRCLFLSILVGISLGSASMANGQDFLSEVSTLLLSQAERGGNGCTIQSISCGQTLIRDISISDCVTESGVFTDFFAFNGVAGQTITATMSSLDFNPYLILFDPDIEVAASDDDSGPGDAAQIIYTLDRTSPDWTLAATPLEPFVFGDYIISLACAGSTPNPPTAPSNLTATVISATRIELAWQDNSNNESSFRVERRTGGGAFTEIGSVGANVAQFQDTTVSPSTTYDYRVKARNSGGDSGYSNTASATTPSTTPTGPCVEDADTICLQGNRFRVEVDFAASGQALAPAHAIPFTDRAGMFWFFNQNNIEMLVKVLNACVEPFNRYWVFFAATTNVEFQVRVTDTQANQTKTYPNPQGMVALPVADTQAFATCP